MFSLYTYLNSVIQTILSFPNVAYVSDIEDYEINLQNESNSHIKFNKEGEVTGINLKKMKSNNLENRQVCIEQNAEENINLTTNNVETFTKNDRAISPVFKKYLPESPEVTIANGFEQCFQSLINSNDWNFNFILPQQLKLPLTCKSVPAMLQKQIDDDEDSYSCTSDCSYVTDITVKRTASDTDLLKRKGDSGTASERKIMFSAEVAERRFGLEWNEKFIETILVEPEQNDDVFLILYVQKRCNSNFLMNDLVIRLLKSFIYPHNRVRVYWVPCLAQYLFTWMNRKSLLIPLFPTQSLYQPYEATLLLSYSAMFLVRHPDLVFFYNIAKVLQISPKRLLLLRALDPSISYNQFL